MEKPIWDLSVLLKWKALPCRSVIKTLNMSDKNKWKIYGHPFSRITQNRSVFELGSENKLERSQKFIQLKYLTICRARIEIKPGWAYVIVNDLA